MLRPTELTARIADVVAARVSAAPSGRKPSEDDHARQGAVGHRIFTLGHERQVGWEDDRNQPLASRVNSRVLDALSLDARDLDVRDHRAKICAMKGASCTVSSMAKAIRTSPERPPVGAWSGAHLGVEAAAQVDRRGEADAGRDRLYW